MIKVKVRLFAYLRRYHPESGSGKPLSLNVEEGTTVQQLLQEKLSVPPEVVKAVFINGIVKESDYVLDDGDRIGIFPPIAGG